MGGTGKNIRNKRKIKEALPIIINPFTIHDMVLMTGMTVKTCSNLLKQFDGLTRVLVRRKGCNALWYYEAKNDD